VNPALFVACCFNCGLIIWQITALSERYCTQLMILENIAKLLKVIENSLHFLLKIGW